MLLLATSPLAGRAACGPAPPARVGAAGEQDDLAGRLAPAGEMSSPRAAHTATLLEDGRVLVAGGCTADSCESGDDSATVEIYDPATGMFTRAGRLSGRRAGHTATLLAGGKVLLAGGWSGPDPTASAETWDPAARTSRPTAPMAARRGGHSATLLGDGTVLIAGGSDRERHLCDAEIYDPITSSFRPAGCMTTPRAAHAAALLADGRVLLTGGSRARGDVVSSAEIYDPASASFRPTGSMVVVRYKHAAVTLRDGQVVVAGGSDARDSFGRYASAEIFDPVHGGFSPVPDMGARRFKITGAAVLLNTGEVLIAGGGAQAELFDPAAFRFSPVAGSLGAALSFSTATLLRDGGVVVLGGYDDRIHLTAGAWLYRAAAGGKVSHELLERRDD